MVSKTKKQDLIKMNWKEQKLASLEKYILHKGSLQ